MKHIFLRLEGEALILCMDLVHKILKIFEGMPYEKFSKHIKVWKRLNLLFLAISKRCLNVAIKLHGAEA